MRQQANLFREAILSRDLQIGLWLGLADPYCAELCAGAGFHWALIDGEHAPNDIRSILGQLQALAPYPTQPVVRPVVGDAHLIKQLLDLGAQTLLIPMVESAAQARDLVAATRYPPEGVRGVGSALARASRWNRQADYLRDCGNEICLLVQIESKQGLAELEAIASVPGVDGVFIGPADLSASLGHLGNAGAPEVQAAVEDAIRKIKAAGKAPGILSADAALARRYIELGCIFVAVGVDTSLLARATEALARDFIAPDRPPGAGSGPHVY